jgi:hypothetical protein
MKLRSIALLATSALCCLNAASLISAASLPAGKSTKAPVAIYYSFDSPPPAALFTEMQSELGRILAPAGLRVTWRSLDVPEKRAEDFPEIVVFRFHGECSFEGGGSGAPVPAGLALAETEIVDGHVLPFGAVACDVVRRFIAPLARSFGEEDKNAALGRALARVSAHEIYHMLTGSQTHGNQGITRSTHSRTDLSASSFTFAKGETDWLRAWAEKHELQEPAARSASARSASARSAEAETVAASVEPKPGEPETASFAGR